MCDAARDKERSTVGTMEEDGMAGRGRGGGERGGESAGDESGEET